PSNCGTSNFSVNYNYDLAGDLTYATNGAGVAISYSYDTAGHPMSVTSNLSDAQHPPTLATIDPNLGYWPNDAIRVMTLGNGLAQTTAYNKRFQPCRLNMNSSGTYLGQCSDAIPNGNLQDFNYGFGTDNGTVTSWTATGQRAFNRTYNYDYLNRIASLSAPSDPSGCTGLSWTVDPLANRTDQTVTGGTCNTFHAPVTANPPTNRFVGPPSYPYTYDAAGNLTNDGLHNYTYDAENRIKSVDNGATASYIYDADGYRVRKVTSGATTDYLYDFGGRVVAEYPFGPTAPSYVYINGQLLAEYVNGTTYFTQLDHLGSTRLLTKVDKSVLDTLDYLPYGEQIAGSNWTSHRFTGYQRDDETGLDYAFARYYNPRLGRFMSGDPAPGDLTDPQTPNRYGYVRNNPVSLTDSTGMDCDDFGCGGFDFPIFFGWGWGGGWDSGRIGPQPPIYTPPQVGSSPNPPTGSLTSDDPFGGETNGIPNGLGIPT